MRVSQFWGWFKNPLTGVKIEPDPVTGLVPFRELDATAQAEVLKNLEESYIGNRFDGAKDWESWSAERMKFNTELDKAKRKQKAEDYAYSLQQVDLRRPWVKFHKRAKKPLYTHYS